MVRTLTPIDSDQAELPLSNQASADALASAPVLMFGGTSSAGTHGPNRDSFAACQPENLALRKHRGVVMAIADGVGSSTTSRVASELAVTEFIDEYLGSRTTRSVRDCAASTVDTLNRWLFAQNSANRAGTVEGDGLVTTFTSIVIKSCTAHVFHAGDSRAWLIRNDDAQPLTQDHFSRYNGRKLLARALGADQSVKLDHLEVNLREGDVIALTTDGVHDTMPVSKVGELLVNSLARSPNNLEQASAQVVRGARANTPDEYDDATCLFARIVSLPLRDEQEIRRRALAVIIPPALIKGMRIDDLEVLGTIHQSTRSHVYLVRRDNDACELVLKAPSRHFTDDALYLQGFARECWLMQGFNHPSLPKGVPVTADSSFLYSLTERVSGTSLRQWMIDHPKPSLAQVRPLISSIVDGLRLLRRAGIVHRDLKPENVIVRSDGQCTIIDFGTARVDGLEELGISLPEDVPVGAIGYVAPESHDGFVDWRSDLYSLAAITFEILTGFLPPQRKPTSMSYERARTRSNRPLLQIRPDLPQWVEFALNKSLAARPDLRHAAYSEFLADLHKPSVEAARQASRQPLVERHPVRFWQCVSLLLFVSLMYCLVSNNS